MTKLTSRMLGLVAGLLVASSAQAAPIPVTFFHSPADNGAQATLPLPATNGTITINLWADPTAAGGGTTFEVQDVILQVSGAISIVSFSCDSGQGGCLAGATTSTQIKFTAGDAANGNSAPFTVGTLVLNVSGAGSLSLIAGTALDGLFVGDNIIPHVVVSFASVPEPATAGLLTVGLAGLALIGRKRHA